MAIFNIMMGVAAMAAISLSFSSPAFAGDGNVIVIEQRSSPYSSVGNSAVIDQSRTSNSFVGGPSMDLQSTLNNVLQMSNSGGTEGEISEALGLASAEFGSNAGVLQPARQIGERNSAEISIDGVGGELQLLQDNDATAVAVGNRAFVEITNAGANTLGGILQVGDNNSATLNVDGAASTGLISQTGTGLTADLTVGAGGNGTIVQAGQDFSSELVVVGSTSAILNATTGGTSQPITGPVQVFSTGTGAVVINQSSF